MKIALPVADGKLCMHFGHCQQFALVDVDEKEKKVNSTSFLDPPPHEPGVLPAWLKEQGADYIIAGGMGSRAQDLFTNYGIKVVVGASSDSPESIVDDFLNDRLVAGVNACDH